MNKVRMRIGVTVKTKKKRFGKENLPQPKATPLACGCAGLCVCVWEWCIVGVRAYASVVSGIACRCARVGERAWTLSSLNCQVKPKKMKWKQWKCTNEVGETAKIWKPSEGRVRKEGGRNGHGRVKAGCVETNMWWWHMWRGTERS